MENLIFSLNATVPVFLLMVLGILFRKAGLFDEHMADKLNRFVFQVTLPAVLFRDLSREEFTKVWDGGFVGFCFIATLISILTAALISRLLGEREIRGEFIQGSYRSSAALLGIAFIQNIYGSSGMAPLMIVGTVPLYNAAAVFILTVTGPKRDGGSKGLLRRTLIGIVKNPIIIGIAVGLTWSLLKLPQPVILAKTVDSIAALATPLGLMIMGAAFDYQKAFNRLAPALAASFLKLIGFTAVFIPIAVSLGYRREELTAILVMLGSATTVSSFVMSRNMGHKGVLSSSVVMITTFLSAFTLTGWLYILKSMGLL